MNFTKIIIVILIISMTTTIADMPLEVSLNVGKNILNTTEYFPPIYASEFLKEHAEIQSISFNEYGNSYGYVRAFGGIGTNILIESGRIYEIQATEPINISLR